MIPQIGPPAPAGSALQTAQAAIAAPAPQEQAARSSGTPETARAIDPPAGLARAGAVMEDLRRNLLPPDPNAPAGPPPAFEASILDRAREEARAPRDLLDAPGATEDGDETRDADGTRPYEVPPSADTRAQAEVGTIRGLETAGGRSIDLSR